MTEERFENAMDTLEMQLKQSLKVQQRSLTNLWISCGDFVQYG